MQKLTSQQGKAIGLLMSGKSQADCAAEIGVDPATVNRWVNGHQAPAFVASYNSARQSLATDCQEQLSNLYIKSVQIITEALNDENGDVYEQRKMALAIIKNGSLPDVHKLETNRLWVYQFLYSNLSR